MSEPTQMTRRFPMGNTKAGKLNGLQVADIRVKYHQEGWSQGRLAREFQVTIGTIGRIVRGETWQNSPHPASNRAAYQEGGHFPLTEEQLNIAAKASEARLLKMLDMEQAPVSAPPPTESWDQALAASEPTEQSSGLDRFQAEIERLAPGAEARAEAMMKKLLEG